MGPINFHTDKNFWERSKTFYTNQIARLQRLHPLFKRVRRRWDRLNQVGEEGQNSWMGRSLLLCGKRNAKPSRRDDSARRIRLHGTRAQ